MEKDIKSEYQRISDKISYDDFLKRIEEMKKDYEDVSFMDELDIARMIVGEYIDEKNVSLVDEEEKGIKKIEQLELGKQNQNLMGRIMKISNTKVFKRKKGDAGKVANIMLADNTGEIKVVLWNESTKIIDKLHEGDVVEVKDVEIRDGFKGDEEAHLNPRSKIKKLDGDYGDLPEYKDKIEAIEDIKPETNVNIMGRIITISRVRSFNSKGRKGKLITLDIKDKTGSIPLTLWNNDVDIIKNLELQEGDSIKVIGARSRERNGEISLNHAWDGRIVKGEFDVPEYKENILKIGDAREMKNVNLMGVVSKIQDKITFERSDGSSGAVKSIVISDGTGAIKVTLWNDDTDLEINKGDIFKITGGNIEFDEYSETDYRLNTGWSSKLTINPENDTGLKEILQQHKKELEPIKIEDLHKIEDEGQEVDIIGRIMELYDANEFQRSDGTMGIVRTVKIADDTGVVRASFWDDKAKLRINRGNLVKIENAKTRFREDTVELSVGKMVRVILMNDDGQTLPSLDKIEENMYKPVKIQDLKNIKSEKEEVGIMGRIVNLFDINEFQRTNGTMGMVRSVEIADDTGVVRASFWDEKAEMGLNKGDAIWIKNARPKFRNDQVELSVGRATMVTKPQSEDMDSIPSLEEIEESIYKTRKIEEIEEEDKNIKVSGKIAEAYGDRILYEMCPNCNKRVEYVDDAFICDFCGEEIQQPNYLMIIPCVIEDETGTIRVTFFRNLAEELIKITTDEANEVIMKTADEGSLAEKVEDLIGSTITIIADASFDEYNEEIRLIAKKIVGMEL